MNTHINTRLHSRKGVAPVIATLLLVAIAVVGGAIVFAYSQSFFSSSQVSGKPTIEAAKIPGYDARPGGNLTAHNGNQLTTVTNDGDAIKELDEHVAIYIKNDSVQPITISEARFGGIVYDYVIAAGDLATMTPGQYTLAEIPAPGGGGTDLTSTAQVAEIQPGQTVSLVVALSEDMRSGRDTQFKLTTNNGAVFVGTVVIGQQSG